MTVARKHWTDEDVRAIARAELAEASAVADHKLQVALEHALARREALAHRALRQRWYRRAWRKFLSLMRPEA